MEVVGFVGDSGSFFTPSAAQFAKKERLSHAIVTDEEGVALIETKDMIMEDEQTLDVKKFAVRLAEDGMLSSENVGFIHMLCDTEKRAICSLTEHCGSQVELVETLRQICTEWGQSVPDIVPPVPAKPPKLPPVEAAPPAAPTVASKTKETRLNAVATETRLNAGILTIWADMATKGVLTKQQMALVCMAYTEAHPTIHAAVDVFVNDKDLEDFADSTLRIARRFGEDLPVPEDSKLLKHVCNRFEPHFVICLARLYTLHRESVHDLMSDIATSTPTKTPMWVSTIQTCLEESEDPVVSLVMSNHLEKMASS